MYSKLFTVYKNVVNERYGKPHAIQIIYYITLFSPILVAVRSRAGNV
jgi:hypothetical protein